MASPITYSSVGGTVGADLVTRSWEASGSVYYVHHTGSDSYAGLDRLKPFATLSAAHTAASAGDTIIPLEDHAETIGTAISFNKAGVQVLCEGSGSTRPRFTCSATIAMFDVTAIGVQFEGCYFPASTAVPTARIRTASTSTWLRGCQFDCGASDTAPAMKCVTGAGAVYLDSVTFTSTATSLTAQPSIGMEVANATADVHLRSVTFDGGNCGWSDYSFKGTAAVTRLTTIDLRLLDASLFVATASVYRVHVADKTGTARLVLTA